jgi:hypothetical protein
MKSRQFCAALIVATGLLGRALAAQPYDGNYVGTSAAEGNCASGGATLSVVEGAVTMTTQSGLKLTGTVAPDGTLSMRETVNLAKGIILDVQGRFDANGFTGTGTRSGCGFRYEMKKQ